MTDRSLYVSSAQAEGLRERSRDLVSWDLSPEQACDIEMILDGSFAPLEGPMTASEVKEVCTSKTWRGHFWPIPIFLDVTTDFTKSLEGASEIALRDQEGVLVAFLTITEQFDSSAVQDHCGKRELNAVCLGGKLTGVEAPAHHDFKRRRLSPTELHTQFDKMGWSKILGFATRRPLHQREVNETYQAASNLEANLLLNPNVGAVEPEDRLHYARVHCYEHVLQHYPHQTTDLALTPLYARGLGLDDALLHALVLKNLGCTHYMIDREYCPTSQTGLDHSQTEEALSAYNPKLGIEIVHNEPMVHAPGRGGYIVESSVATAEQLNRFSTETLIERLRAGVEIPDWYSYPEIVDELRKVYRPNSEQGVTVFFTGLSGSGKSSIANALLVKMMEIGDRPITLLDGDIVRQNLSSELGFSKEHRDLNIRRIGYVASQITKNGGMAICAPIAPYSSTRRFVRDMIEDVGGFVEVHVATSLEVCEKRDRKGLYAKARAGIVKEFTGISDPYEVPEKPELKIDTQGTTAEEAAQRVILTLQKLGYIKLA